MSEERKNETPEQSQPEEEKLDKKEAKAKAKLEEQLEKANADRDYWKNEYYKVHADTQNLRKSLEDERRAALKYRAEGFVDELLPALDAFHIVLDATPPNDQVKNYLVGFQYIYNQIENVLEKEGVTSICPAIGDKYDALTMHAVEAIENDGEPNRILKVQAKGYKLHDRLIRPVMVSVSKKAGESKEEKEEDKPEGEAPEGEKVHKA
ncbi:MAG: nucleotide exchange factor GrpE [Bacillota bacterium]|nr:nucleotide exchange factor GrpE [Bacillota bacterium]